MIVKAYSIRDQVAGIFHAPQYAHTPGAAERDFKEIVNDKNTMIAKHPEGYDLYHIGEYDNSTGKFTSLETPQFVVKAVQLVSPVN